MTTKAQKIVTSPDNVAILQLVQNLEDGWTKKDGKLFAKSFAENADYVIINGHYIQGRERIAGGHQTIFNTVYKETFIKLEVKSIRYIRPDIAIVHASSNMTGTAHGAKVDTKAQISLTVEKTASGWQIDAFQNTSVEEQ